MNVVVFGATGRTGMEIVKQALAEGHTVTAFVRDPSKLEINDENLRFVQGDITNKNQVSQAIQNQETVVVALGPGPNAPPKTITEGMRYIIEAMQTHGVQRVIAISGAGIDIASDRKRLFDRIVSVLVHLFNREDAREKEQQYLLFKQSDLDWTLVRPPVLTAGTHTGEYQTDVHTLNGKPRLSRADLADFMVREIADRRYTQQPVFIGG